MKHNRRENHHPEEDIPVHLLDEQALAYLRKNGAMSVTELHDAFKMRYPSLTEVEVTDLVWRLVERGKVDVEDLPPATDSLWKYMQLWERNLWFYTSIVISLLTILAIYTVPSDFPFVMLRWVLGSAFVLFIPGYASVDAVFPKGRDLNWIERIALGVGLSLALVSLVGLLLNYTPWGIRLTPIVVSLSILTIGLSFVGLGRRFGISIEA